ncbi:MAG: TauD/TfdA family dioxygenase [Pusillimonas sp.]
MAKWNQRIIHPSAWKSEDLTRDKSWIFELGKSQVAELETGLLRFKKLGIPPTAVSRENYPLPGLAVTLEQVLQEIEQRRGVAILRGIPVDRYSVEDLSTMYLALGNYLGERISQTAEGIIVGHVSDMGYAYGQENVRGYYTRAKLLFHTDNADIVGLLCVRKAKQGGSSSVASTISIYNEILEHHPLHLEQCFAGFHYDCKGENPPGVPPVTPHRVPVFSYHEGLLSSCFNTSYIEQGAMHRGVPLTQQEQDTINLINTLAARDDLRFDLLLEPGDIQFINDHTTIHSRTEFTDYEEPEQKRLMLRLWLRVPNGRPMAQEIADRGYGPGAERRGVPPFREAARKDGASLRST